MTFLTHTTTSSLIPVIAMSLGIVVVLAVVVCG